MRTLLLATLLAGNLHAADSAAMRCGDFSLKGSFGYVINGTRPISPEPGSVVEQISGVGIREYDGRGNFTQVDTLKGSVTGVQWINNRLYGTYEVSPDCTGVMRLFAPSAPAPAELRFVVVNNGKEIHWILINPPVGSVVGHAVRQ
jgi:hypothetical protein